MEIFGEILDFINAVRTHWIGISVPAILGLTGWLMSKQRDLVESGLNPPHSHFIRSVLVISLRFIRNHQYSFAIYIILISIIVGSFLAYTEKNNEFKAVLHQTEDRKHRELIVDHLNVAKSKISRLVAYTVHSEVDFDSWQKKREELIIEIEIDLKMLLPASQVNALLLTMPDIPVLIPGGYSGQYNLNMRQLIKISDQISLLANKYSP